jgi:hypothetical protein
MAKEKVIKSDSIRIKDTTEEVTRKSLEKDGITKSIEVKKVVNGFVIYICESGYKGEKWINNDQTYISLTNPLDDDTEKEKSFKETISEALKNLKLK